MGYKKRKVKTPENVINELEKTIKNRLDETFPVDSKWKRDAKERLGKWAKDRRRRYKKSLP